MLEVEQASVNVEAQARLEQIRAQMGIATAPAAAPATEPAAQPAAQPAEGGTPPAG